MTTILSYLRLILFLGGALVGVQVPGFVAQYGQSLESHLRESGISLQAFQQDADKYFGGDLHRLIAHYKSNGDPVFNAGGGNIDAIYQRNTTLKAAMLDFAQGRLSAYEQVFVHPVADIRDEVWKNYSYGIKLDASAIVVGLLLGFLMSVLVEIPLRGLILALLALTRKPQRRY
ncbi:MAG TPA: DUF2937 family protein [Stenotrophobium sp.]|jgi:hypothetical protein|nr:DUF2937 family protein [Stenotrophobium sp.]